MRDVPEFARTRLRTIEGRPAWASMGYSAGGYCAAVAGVLHPDTFGAAVVLSGYVRPDFSESATGPVWPAGSAAARRYDLLEAVRTHMPSVAVWLQSGRQSPYWPATQEFVQAVRPPMSVTTQVQPDSGHRWDVWKAQLPSALAWLGGQIPGFRPTA